MYPMHAILSISSRSYIGMHGYFNVNDTGIVPFAYTGAGRLGGGRLGGGRPGGGRMTVGRLGGTNLGP